MMPDLEAQVRARAPQCKSCWGTGLSDNKRYACLSCNGRGYILTAAAVARALQTLDEEWRADWAVSWGEGLPAGITPMQAALAALQEERDG